MSGDSFSVKAMTRLTGLNEHTLRAWERRYGAVTPRRGDNGRRVYSREDVERLRNIAALVERGFAIGRIATLSDQELAQLLADNLELDHIGNGAPKAESSLNPAANRVPTQLERIQEALLQFDLAKIHGTLTESRYLMGARGFVLDLVTPLMEAVGWMTLSGRITIGHEHALSAIVRAHLSFMLLEIPRRETSADGENNSFALTTMEGNFHEIGILVASVLCALRGVTNYFLGPNLPVPALTEAVIALNARHIVIGSTSLPPGTLPITEHEYLQELDKRLPPFCEIWVGGPLIEFKESKLKHKFRFIRTLVGFDEMVGTL
ncbi:MAG: MerR family transcriptional regulator [Deltaproteobacteria bacterium]|nr:MerR family transcriptional regulator [Deltaproteobacteria bacterium]